jgi:hypothetical protein
MLERATIRFWLPIVAAAGFFPMVAFLMLGTWFIGVYFSTTMTTESAAPPPVAAVPAGAEDAVVSPPAMVAEAFAALPAAQPRQPSLVEGSADLAAKQDASAAQFAAVQPNPAAASDRAAPPIDLSLPLPAAAEALPPSLEPSPPEMVDDAGAAAPEEKHPQFAPALPMLATFALAPPAQFSLEPPIPLPKPKPKVAPASRPILLQPPRPAESNLRPSFQ